MVKNSHILQIYVIGAMLLYDFNQATMHIYFVNVI